MVRNGPQSTLSADRGRSRAELHVRASMTRSRQWAGSQDFLLHTTARRRGSRAVAIICHGRSGGADSRAGEPANVMLSLQAHCRRTITIGVITHEQSQSVFYKDWAQVSRSSLAMAEIGV